MNTSIMNEKTKGDEFLKSYPVAPFKLYVCILLFRKIV